METTALRQIQSFSTAPSQRGVAPPPTVNTPLSAGQPTLPNTCVRIARVHPAPPHPGGGEDPTPIQGEGEQDENAKDLENSGKNGLDQVPNIDIFISNVVCTFSVRCHLNLKRIGMEGYNVEYKRESGKVVMKVRNPNCTATIWSSGKITITGNSSEIDARKSARKIARQIQKMGFRVHYHQFKVVNVLGTCRMPFAIRIANFSEEYPRTASYEPELHPAVTYKIKSPKATLKIFSTGSITVTAPSVENIQHAIHQIYPLVEPYQMPRRVDPPPKVTKQEVTKQEVTKQEVIHVRGPEPGSEEDDDDEEWESELSDDDL